MNKNIRANNLPSSHINHILHITELAPKIFRIRINNKKIPSIASPGQFINIKITDCYQILWRRPFSIHRVNREEGWIEILFRVIGKGTDFLSKRTINESFNFIGPLGKGFDYPLQKGKKVMVVAGGLGIAPILFLCHELIKRQVTPYLYYGVKTESEFCCLEDFERLNIKAHLATEDGTIGYRGFVTSLLEKDIDNSNISCIYACGPNPMLHQVNFIAEKNSIPCQVSLETLMACGIGACLGCGVKTKGKEVKYFYVCKDGPVFNSKEVDLSD